MQKCCLYQILAKSMSCILMHHIVNLSRQQNLKVGARFSLGTGSNCSFVWLWILLLIPCENDFYLWVSCLKTCEFTFLSLLLFIFRIFDNTFICFNLLILVLCHFSFRFATVKFTNNLKGIQNSCMHLTNYSVNKRSSDYVLYENYFIFYLAIN